MVELEKGDEDDIKTGRDDDIMRDMDAGKADYKAAEEYTDAALEELKGSGLQMFKQRERQREGDEIDKKKDR